MQYFKLQYSDLPREYGDVGKFKKDSEVMYAFGEMSWALIVSPETIKNALKFSNM